MKVQRITNRTIGIARKQYRAKVLLQREAFKALNFVLQMHTMQRS
ncbi:hypothetical protein FTV88_3058 [Heliorestis convoluta]|uniref:Uncharacterized protein n=1 Tax=Heliorestis convoluta TaxID=356322 RepID=A0A5Q2N5B4_9FIRM|nr:hypothetical protein FTV88_3058 [Heliorestis convoluta]